MMNCCQRAFCAFCILFAVSVTGRCAPRAETTHLSEAVARLFSLSLPDASGTQQSLAQFKGKPLVVHFWASWCGPCAHEMPALSALSREFSAKGVQFVGISVDSAANVKQFTRKIKVDYPLLIAGFGGVDLARGFGNPEGALPFTIVFDARGAVRYTELGAIIPVKLRKQLNQL